MPASTEVTAAAKNTPYIDLMRESCENVAGQSQDKKNLRKEEEKRREEKIKKKRKEKEKKRSNT